MKQTLEERKAYRKAYYEAHKEERRASSRAYGEAHKEERRARSKAWHKAHKGEQKAYRKAYYEAHKEERRASSRAYYEAHKEETRVRQYKRKYGVTLADYNRMYKEQKGGCKICGRRPKRRLHVDHDHTTGVVRGLLCSSCNLALGLLSEDSSVVEKVVRYLKRAG